MTKLPPSFRKPGSLGCIQLTVTDRDTTILGDQLTDLHIDVAQAIIVLYTTDYNYEWFSINILYISLYTPYNTLYKVYFEVTPIYRNDKLIECTSMVGIIVI